MSQLSSVSKLKAREQLTVAAVATPSNGGRPGVAAPLAFAVAALVIAVGWFVLARQGVASAEEARREASLARARGLMTYQRDLVSSQLKVASQLLAEDPRLKTTLATEGIDEGTIVDVLTDLRRQSGLDLVAVLSPLARLQAVLGADEYRGLDLSTSKVVQQADATEGAAAGVWVAGDRVLNVAVIALRFSRRLVGYLVVGSAIDGRTVSEISELAGAGVAVVVDDRVALVSPQELRPALTQAAARADSPSSVRLNVDGVGYQSLTTRIEGTVPAVRLAFVTPSADRLGWVGTLLWVPMLAAVLFAGVLLGRAVLK